MGFGASVPGNAGGGEGVINAAEDVLDDSMNGIENQLTMCDGLNGDPTALLRVANNISKFTNQAAIATSAVREAQGINKKVIQSF